MKIIKKQLGFSSLDSILVIVAVLLAISNLITAYFYIKNTDKIKIDLPLVNNSLNNDKENKDNLANLNNKEASGLTIEDEGRLGENWTEKIKEDDAAGKIEVEWSEWPSEISWSNVFYVDNKNYYDEENEDVKKFLASLKLYKTGRIKSGPYAGGDFYLINYPPYEAPSFRDYLHRAIKYEDKIIILARYSDEISDEEIKYFGNYTADLSINKKITIANSETPKEISIPDSKMKFIKTEDEPMILAQFYQEPKKLFKYSGENYVYRDNARGCFFVKAGDSTVREYRLDLDFVTKEKEEDFYNSSMLLNVVWSNGEKNNDKYILRRVTGCGLSNCFYYPEYIKNIDQLKEAGKTEKGDSVYELKDINLTDEGGEKSVLQNVYDYYQPGFNNSEQASEKVSYEEFLKDHPLVYWQDPFGDFIELMKAEYMPAVECGKPVIYLYPEKEIDVSVRVNPTGGFSYTEPDYGSGWNVSAKPSGEIYNYQNNKIYPYLFWEGRGVNYIRPDKGFVIKREDLKLFLEDKLSDLGLIKKEYDEFVDFWLPKMQKKNYYFITFIPQNEFNNIAPLSVNPKPDTIIRVFMDFEGLDGYKKVEEQKIIAPQRKGFTVVEWGGALH